MTLCVFSTSESDVGTLINRFSYLLKHIYVICSGSTAWSTASLIDSEAGSTFCSYFQKSLRLDMLSVNLVLIMYVMLRFTLCMMSKWKHQTQIIAIFIWKYMSTFTNLRLTLWPSSDYNYLDCISWWICI